MASNSFKVKNSLVLTPKDLATLTSPEAGDLACDINDSNKIKRYDAASASWVEVGSGGGVGGVDIFFVQDFESASLSSFTQTGLVLSQTDPLKGKVSAVLTHQAAINQSFKQVIPVDRKFRGQTMVLRLDAKSNASAGNLVIKITNETASTDLVASEQLEISNDVNGAKSSVSFTIPESCASLSYTITALPQSGSPVSRIDDIICELASTALLETAVEVPVVTGWQGYTPTFQGFGTPTNVEFEWRQVGENVEIRGKFVSGTSTAVQARISLPAGLTSATTTLIPSLQVVGKANTNSSTVNTFSGLTILANPSVSYLTVGVESSTRNGLTEYNGSDIAGSGTPISFFASVPCAGLSATTTKTIPLTQSGLIQEADSMLRLDGGNGYGSTATKIRRFTNVRQSLSSDVLYQDSATLGASFTIQTSGVYSFSYTDYKGTAGAEFFGLSRNASSLTTNITSLAAGEILILEEANGSASGEGSCSWTGYLQAGDVIRPHSNGALSGVVAVQNTLITISRQGSLKQVSVITNQKATIPTSELRFEGASSRGSTATSIVRFDTQAKLRGDAFSVVSDATNGTAVTMLKAGKLDVSSSLVSASGQAMFISLNQVDLTNIPTGTEALAADGFDAGSTRSSCSWSGHVKVGDVIRVSCSGTPTANTRNSLNLSFQEQSVQVSVSNTLPQFSESDLVVRAAGNAGQAITASVTNIPFIATLDTTGGAWNGSQFTVTEDGVYNLSGSVNFTVAGTGVRIRLYVDGAIYRVIGGSDASASSFNFNITDNFSAGQILSVRSGDTRTLSNSSDFHYLNITKVGKPNVTGVNVTPFVNVPQPEIQTYTALGGAAKATTDTFILNFNGSTVSSSGSNSLFSVSSSAANGTVITALKRGKMSLSASYIINSTAGRVGISKNQSTALTTYPASNENIILRDFRGQTAGGDYVSITASEFSVQAGDRIRVYSDNPVTGGAAASINVTMESASAQILTAPETFSTDTASLQYASSSLYNLTTLASAPVGTYITFTYAANTNTRTQTTTRPTQTDADMNANGMLIYTRAYNAASTAAQPSTVAIQIGKGLKGINTSLYKTTGKSISGDLDNDNDGSQSYGAMANSYTESTGILLVDAGWRVTTVTSAVFLFSDVSSATSGYLVINASKNPALTGLGLNTVAARAINSSGQSLPASSVTTVTYDANKTYDTHGALNTSTGVFTAPESGYYHVSAHVYFSQQSYPANTEMYCQLMKNGVLHVYGYNWENEALVTAAPTSTISTGIFLAKGDTLRLEAWNGRASATPLFASAAGSFFSIHKIGV